MPEDGQWFDGSTCVDFNTIYRNGINFTEIEGRNVSYTCCVRKMINKDAYSFVCCAK
jgi:hypothetical protein